MVRKLAALLMLVPLLAACGAAQSATAPAAANPSILLAGSTLGDLLHNIWVQLGNDRGCEACQVPCKTSYGAAGPEYLLTIQHRCIGNLYDDVTVNLRLAFARTHLSPSRKALALKEWLTYRPQVIADADETYRVASARCAEKGPTATACANAHMARAVAKSAARLNAIALGG